jgi:uncharacterized membrane protein YtjA (UPF0391 family)
MSSSFDRVPTPVNASAHAIVPAVAQKSRPQEVVPTIGAAHWNLPRGFAFKSTATSKEDIMFGWAITFLVIALIAGLLGFGVVAGTAFAAAKIVFVVALIAFLISGVLGISGRGIP